MATNKNIALLGSALLAIGVFLPLVSVPIVGSLNYFRNGTGDGLIMLVIAATAVGFALTGRENYIFFAGLASVALLLFTFINLQARLAEMKAQMDEQLTGNPFRGLADMAYDSIQMQWGWAVLLLGAGLITYAGWRFRQEAPATDAEAEQP
jgi:hypothetical protein